MACYYAAGYPGGITAGCGRQKGRDAMTEPGIERGIRTEKVRERAAEYIELLEAGEYVGLCAACGYIQEGCEPDAHNYECENCGKRAVSGPCYNL